MNFSNFLNKTIFINNLINFFSVFQGKKKNTAEEVQHMSDDSENEKMMAWKLITSRLKMLSMWKWHVSLDVYVMKNNWVFWCLCVYMNPIFQYFKEPLNSRSFSYAHFYDVYFFMTVKMCYESDKYLSLSSSYVRTVSNSYFRS